MAKQKKPAANKVASRRKISPVWILTVQAVRIMKRHWRLFGGLLVIYAVSSLILVNGLSRTVDLVSVKAALRSTNAGVLTSGTEMVSTLFTNSTSSSASTTYQLILFIIMSLAVIWALRHAYADTPQTPVRAKQAMYQGMTPLIPFVLVLLVIGLELVPFMVGTSVYAVVSHGIAQGVGEQLLWTVGLFALMLWSFYMLASSIFALYVVTLPDMPPRKALRLAKELVARRRFVVLRKLLFLPLLVLIIILLVMMPVILLLTPIAEWILLVFGLLLVMFCHSYLYAMYRELM